MKKRGQFFLIAAFVIIAVVAGLAATKNFARTTKEDSTVYNLAEEIDFEASQVLFNGIYTGDTQNVDSRIKELVTFYAKTNPESDIAVYYGDEQQVKAIVYEAEDCEIALSPPEDSEGEAPITGRVGDGLLCTDNNGYCAPECGEDSHYSPGDDECSPELCCIVDVEKQSTACTDKGGASCLSNCGSGDVPYSAGDDECAASGKVCCGVGVMSCLSKGGSCETVCGTGETHEPSGDSVQCSVGNKKCCVLVSTACNNGEGTCRITCSSGERDKGGVNPNCGASRLCCITDTSQNQGGGGGGSRKTTTPTNQTNSTEKNSTIKSSSESSSGSKSNNSAEESSQQDSGSSSSTKRGRISGEGAKKYELEDDEEEEISVEIRGLDAPTTFIKIRKIEREPVPEIPVSPEEEIEEEEVEVEIIVEGVSTKKRIKEFSKEKVGDYEIGIGQVKDKEKIDVGLVSSEKAKEAEESLVLLSPGRVCFDTSNINAPPTTTIEGRNITEGTATLTGVPGDKKVEVKFGDTTKQFNIKEGQNFFLVVKKEREGERTVAIAE